MKTFITLVLLTLGVLALPGQADAAVSVRVGRGFFGRVNVNVNRGFGFQRFHGGFNRFDRGFYGFNRGFAFNRFSYGFPAYGFNRFAVGYQFAAPAVYAAPPVLLYGGYAPLVGACGGY